MRRDKLFKIFFIMIQVIFFIFTITSTVFATNFWKIYDPIKNPFDLSIGKIIGIIQVVGMSIAVIMLTYIGIKFIYASPEGKAELKQQLFPYLIGCLLLFGGAWFIGLIANFAITEIR